MSFVVAVPDSVDVVASAVAGIGSQLTTAHAVAAPSTTGVLAAAADEVSIQIAAIFSRHGVGFQQLSAKAAAFQEQFAAALSVTASSYAAAEAGAVKALVNTVNAPARALAGHSLIGTGQALGGATLPTAVSHMASFFSGNVGGALLTRPTGGLAAAAVSGSLSQLATLTGAMALPPAGGIPGAIENLYNAVEPYVAYAVNLASWALRWLPWLGWIAPQLNYIYYLFEPIVQSWLFNTLDWLGGEITFIQAWSNFWATTAQSINCFINTEINWIRSFLPPLPPLPPA